MFTIKRGIASGLAIALGVLSIAGPRWAQAQAQTASPASEPLLQEVVVTARKREETLLDVPVTENVFTAQTIESAGIEAPSDFVASHTSTGYVLVTVTGIVTAVSGASA